MKKLLRLFLLVSMLGASAIVGEAAKAGISVPKPPPAPAPVTPVAPVAPAPVEQNYWLTIKGGTRHNSKCRYFHQSQGRPCTKDEGTACKICGG